MNSKRLNYVNHTNGSNLSISVRFGSLHVIQKLFPFLKLSVCSGMSFGFFFVLQRDCCVFCLAVSNPKSGFCLKNHHADGKFRMKKIIFLFIG